MARTAEQIITELSAIVGGALDTTEIATIADRVIQWETKSSPAVSPLAPVFLTDMNGRLVELYSEGHTPPVPPARPTL